VDKFQPKVLDDFAALRSLLDTYFKVEFRGVEKLPRTGGALLVGNHGRTGLDAFIFTGVALDKVGRPVRGLADRMLFRVPVFRDFIAAAGGVPGTRENAVRLLRDGQLVVVYPGGNREVMKSAHKSYKLLWGDRVGFVRVALEAGVPIIPFAGLGVEELYHDLPFWEAFEQKGLTKLFEAATGKVPLAPLGGLHHGPLPNPARLTFKFGDPMPTRGLDPQDADQLLRFQQEVKAQVEALMQDGPAEHPAASAAR
jgi:1-acyl-sn-glycerol-3-phosphate acyltransferase